MILHRTIPAKRLLALLASVCMATAMGACSPNGDSQSQQQPSSQSRATADAGNVRFSLRQTASPSLNRRH